MPLIKCLPIIQYKMRMCIFLHEYNLNFDWMKGVNETSVLSLKEPLNCKDLKNFKIQIVCELIPKTIEI